MLTGHVPRVLDVILLPAGVGASGQSWTSEADLKKDFWTCSHSNFVACIKHVSFERLMCVSQGHAYLALSSISVSKMALKYLEIYIIPNQMSPVCVSLASLCWSLKKLRRLFQASRS